MVMFTFARAKPSDTAVKTAIASAPAASARSMPRTLGTSTGQRRNDPRARRRDRQLHLHRLEQDERLAVVEVLALMDVDAKDGARHGGCQGAARPERARRGRLVAASDREVPALVQHEPSGGP